MSFDYKKFLKTYEIDLSDLFDFKMKRCPKCGLLYFGNDGHICFNRR